MTVTVLAITFIIIVLLVTVVGFKAVIKQGKKPEDINKERCSICGVQYHKAQLIERQIGDHHLYFFCGTCISSLHSELISKH